MFQEYRMKTNLQLEEARVREERLLKRNEDFKTEMKQQAEETQKLMKQLMEMMKKKTSLNPRLHLILACFIFVFLFASVLF